MNVARYWARADIEAEDPRGRVVCRSAVRGSDVSADHARSEAEKACAELARRIRAGDEPDWYAYDRSAKPEPIEREWLTPEGTRAAAITMSRHGVPVLNTASLVIVDIDLPGLAKPPGALARLFGKKAPPPPEEAPLSALRAWCRMSTARSARIYRTAGGLRYILPNLPLEPTSDAAQSLMAHLGADPRYALLCKHQHSYRARLAPKPWRIEYPVIEARALQAMIESNVENDPRKTEYVRAKDQYATCALIEHLGPEAAGDQQGELIRVHDELCRATSGLPLA